MTIIKTLHFVKVNKLHGNVRTYSFKINMDQKMVVKRKKIVIL